MSYIDITSCEEPIKNHYWKIVLVYKGRYYGVYTKEILKKGVWNTAKHIDRWDIPIKGIVKKFFRRGHATIPNVFFSGYGVFSTRKDARLYAKELGVFQFHYKTWLFFKPVIIKVIAKDNHRISGLSCPHLRTHIFDKIKTVEVV